MDVRQEYATVTLSSVSPKPIAEARISENLLDNRWHTIQFLYQYGNLNLIVDSKSTIIGKSILVLPISRFNT